MKNVTDFLFFLNLGPLTEGFGININTNVLETNSINLGIVISFLIYFGKGVLSNLLDNRKRTILSTIRDAEERYREATDKLQQARTFLQQAEIKADEIRSNGLARMEREKQDLIDAADADLKRLEESKSSTIRFEEQRAIEQVRQQVSRLALKKAIEDLNSCSNNESNLRIIDYHIGLLGSTESMTY